APPALAPRRQHSRRGAGTGTVAASIRTVAASIRTVAASIRTVAASTRTVAATRTVAPASAPPAAGIRADDARATKGLPRRPLVAKKRERLGRRALSKGEGARCIGGFGQANRSAL